MRFYFCFFGKMMESDFEFKYSYEFDDLEYNFIFGYVIEVEELMINEDYYRDY